jgi:hypothetical protein
VRYEIGYCLLSISILLFDYFFIEEYRRLAFECPTNLGSRRRMKSGLWAEGRSEGGSTSSREDNGARCEEVGVEWPISCRGRRHEKELRFVLHGIY